MSEPVEVRLGDSSLLDEALLPQRRRSSEPRSGFGLNKLLDRALCTALHEALCGLFPILSVECMSLER